MFQLALQEFETVPLLEAPSAPLRRGCFLRCGPALVNYPDPLPQRDLCFWPSVGRLPRQPDRSIVAAALADLIWVPFDWSFGATVGSLRQPVAVLSRMEPL